MKKIADVCNEKITKINNRKIAGVEWILVGVIAFFMYSTMFYEDLIIIYHHSLTWLDSLFSGDLANFYGNTLENSVNGVGAVYYWTVYFVVGVWNLPIWILHKLFEINMYSVKCMLWMKIEIVFFFVLAIRMMGLVLNECKLSKEKCRWGLFMFISALTVLVPVMATAQVDIITVFLMLWGIKEYLKSDKVTWKFLLIFSFAGSLKVFALFIMIPLILLKEKRIIHVLIDLLCGLIFTISSIVPYGWRTDYHESSDFLNEIMTERLFLAVFPAGNADIPIFISLLVAIFVWAYIKKLETLEEYYYYVPWIGLLVFANFFIFVFAHPYWIVLLAPFVVLVMSQNVKDVKVNMILEFFINLLIMVFYIATFGVFMMEYSFDYLIFPKFGINKNGGYTGLQDLLIQKELYDYMPVVFGLFVVCLVAFIILNYPGRTYKLAKMEANKNIDEKYDYGMIVLRIVVLGVYILGNIYFAYIG